MRNADPLDETFGGILRRILEEHDLSQHRVAQLSGYGTDTISRLANGKRPPTEVQVLRIGASLLLDKQRIKVMNWFLEAADFIPLPVPGREVPDDGDYRPTERPWSNHARRRSLEARRKAQQPAVQTG